MSSRRETEVQLGYDINRKKEIIKGFEEEKGNLIEQAKIEQNKSRKNKLLSKVGEINSKIKSTNLFIKNNLNHIKKAKKTIANQSIKLESDRLKRLITKYTNALRNENLDIYDIQTYLDRIKAYVANVRASFRYTKNNSSGKSKRNIESKIRKGEALIKKLVIKFNEKVKEIRLRKRALSRNRLFKKTHTNGNNGELPLPPPPLPARRTSARESTQAGGHRKKSKLRKRTKKNKYAKHGGGDGKIVRKPSKKKTTVSLLPFEGIKTEKKTVVDLRNPSKTYMKTANNAGVLAPPIPPKTKSTRTKLAYELKLLELRIAIQKKEKELERVINKLETQAFKNNFEFTKKASLQKKIKRKYPGLTYKITELQKNLLELQIKYKITELSELSELSTKYEDVNVNVSNLRKLNISQDIIKKITGRKRLNNIVDFRYNDYKNKLNRINKSAFNRLKKSTERFYNQFKIKTLPEAVDYVLATNKAAKKFTKLLKNSRKKLQLDGKLNEVVNSSFSDPSPIGAKILRESNVPVISTKVKKLNNSKAQNPEEFEEYKGFGDVPSSPVRSNPKLEEQFRGLKKSIRKLPSASTSRRGSGEYGSNEQLRRGSGEYGSNEQLRRGSGEYGFNKLSRQDNVTYGFKELSRRDSETDDYGFNL